MKKLRSQQAKEEISTACIMLKAAMVVFSIKEAIKDNSNNIGNIAKVAGKGSVIDNFVQIQNWETLFKNQDWLSLLSTAENVNILLGDKLSPYLATICKYFPNETKGHLIPRQIYNR